MASIEREWHPRFNRHQWKKVLGAYNPTHFLTDLPDLKKLSLEPHDCNSPLHEQASGWVVSGYSFPKSVVEQRTVVSTDGKHRLLEFGYASRLLRMADDLRLLGYEVVDTGDTFLSILNHCGYTVEQVGNMAGPLNRYSLLSSVAEAERFQEAIKADSLNPNIVPGHHEGVIVEVWG